MSSSHLVVDIVISINRETTDFRWTFAIGQDTQLDFVILLVRISTFLRTECERYPPVTVRRLALAMRCRRSATVADRSYTMRTYRPWAEVLDAA